MQSERDLRLSLPTVFNAGLSRNTSQTPGIVDQQSGKYMHSPARKTSFPEAAPLIILLLKHGTFTHLRPGLDPPPSRSALLKTPRDSQLTCSSLLQPAETTTTFAAKSTRSIQYVPMMLRTQSSQSLNPTGSAERGSIVLPSGF
jgi:hypothetical protein